MKSLNRIFVSCILIWCYQSIFACDICGNYMGATPYNNRNSISLIHRYRVFNGYRYYQSTSHFFPANAYRVMHGGGADTGYVATSTHSSEDFESYKVFELRAKYFILKRLEVNAFLPVLNNKTKANNVSNAVTGFGDVTLSGGYHLILPKEENRVKQKLILGAGIKLPTGDNNYTDAKDIRLPFEMQPGTGSTDGLLYLNYVLMNAHLGVNANMSYKLNGENKFHEKVSNSTTSFLSVFYKIKIENVAVYPSVMASYEYTKGIVTKNKLDKTTALNCLMVGPGLDIYYKSFSMNTSWQFTVAEKVINGNLKSVGRISVGINYSFGTK